MSQKFVRAVINLQPLMIATRLRVLRLYPSKHVANTVKFLYAVIENFLFPIQRIQTDWGTEFYNDLFQEELATF